MSELLISEEEIMKFHREEKFQDMIRDDEEISKSNNTIVVGVFSVVRAVDVIER